MIYICESETELKPVVINVREDVGIADVWLNKNIEQTERIDIVTDDDGNETQSTTTVWTAQQGYYQCTASDTLEADITADFDAWFEYAKAWEPQTTSTDETTQALAAANARIDDLEAALLEMSETVYA